MAPEPDLRSPARFLGWLVRSQRWRVARAGVIGTAWLASLLLAPLVLAQAVDALAAGDRAALAGWALALFGTSVLATGLGVLRHGTMTLIRVTASQQVYSVLTRHAVRAGAALPRGEAVAVAATDPVTIARTLTVTGPGVGSVVATVGTGALLISISPPLAAVVLIGVPLLVVGLRPLLTRLRHAEAGYRERQGELTRAAADVVAGLRVLHGAGGAGELARRHRTLSQGVWAAGLRVADVASWVEALTIGLPAVFLAAVTWLGAHLAASGAITVGELVAVYGFVAALAVAVEFLVQGAGDLPRGLVAAGRVLAVLTAAPAAAPAGPPLAVEPGLLTVVTSDDPALAPRVTCGDRAVLVADADAYLFAGPVPAGPDARAAAAATELTGELADGARTLSGGQRQRVRVARALDADPDVLVLVTPTTALDAPTETRVAQRLRAFRAGRTTVVLSTSPLLAAYADRVVAP